MNELIIRSLEVTRYVIPLREGGSLPAIIEAEDEFLYVLKFRGAGQGKKALVAELIGGELARLIGLNVPEIVFLELDNSFSKAEPDEEIQDLLKFSIGLNIGMSYLPQAITYDPVVSEADPLTASKVVLLDSLITNIDRTARNPNLLSWNHGLWLIDHGASMYFHHAMDRWKDHAMKGFPAVKDHVLLEKATLLKEAASELITRLNDASIEAIVQQVPEDWLLESTQSYTPAERKEIYIEFLTHRVDKLEMLLKEILDARKAHI